MKHSRINRKWTKKVAFLTVATSITIGTAGLAPLSAWADLSNGNSVSVKITSPKVHALVRTPELPITVIASGFTVDAGFAGTPVSATVGHYHEILDGKLIDMAPVMDSTKDTISMMGVKRGRHTLTIVPARNDHSMVMSGAASIPFTYSGKFIPLTPGYKGSEAPSITITSPASGSTVTGSSFTLAAKVSNFVICGGCFGKNLVHGEGHWHIFVDQPMMANMLTMASGPTQDVSLKGITPGVHTFWAVLVDNSHMPFMDMKTKMMFAGTATSIQLNVQP